MPVLILGDCHAQWDKLIAAIAAGVSRHGASTIIQVGDFGFFPMLFPRLEERLSQRPFPVPVHVIEGNHDDHAWLWGQHADGAFARWAAWNLIVHRRGEVAAIEGISTGFLGGALHADRNQEGSTAKATTCWVMDREADRAAVAFDTASVDLVVTHSCPHSIGIGMRGAAELFIAVERYIRARGFDPGPFEDCGEPGLSRLYSRLAHRPRSWVYGHFHTHRVARVGTTEFRCVGSSDGSDGRSPSAGHLLDPELWTWEVVEL